MKAYWTVVMTSVVSFALVPQDGSAETIEVYGCSPGYFELGEGKDMVCIEDPDWIEPGVPDPIDGRENPDGYGKPSGGGGRGKPTRPPGAGAGAAKAKKRATCKKCKAGGKSCRDQAQLAENTCMQNAAAMAQWRCDIIARDGVENTVTAWGCSIVALIRGSCAAAEAPWNAKSNWDYSCGEQNGSYQCWGPALSNCKASWAESHPTGSQQVVDSGQFSAAFQGVGPSASQTLTAAYQLTGQQGYLAACADMGGALDAACTDTENQCYAENDCSKEDLNP